MGSISPIASEAALKALPEAANTKKQKNDSEDSGKSIAAFAANSDAVILDASLGTKTSQANSKSVGRDNFQDLYKALSLTSKEIVDKINEQLKVSLPEGVQSLKPEDVTPEATADRIVSGITALFDIYAKQKKNLSGDALVDSFISEVQKGVTQGYGDALKILEATGALKVTGVQDGVEKTRSLIDEKLSAFAIQKKTDLSGEPSAETSQSDQPPAEVDAVA